VAGGVAEAVVFALRVGGGGVVEGWASVGRFIVCCWLVGWTYRCLLGEWRGT